MRVLIVDYLSPKGHEGWFKLQFDSIVSLGHEVKCVFRDGFNDAIGIQNDCVLFTIPSRYYSKALGLKLRWEYLKILFYIKKRINENDWDAIIMSSYETISLGLYQIFDKAIIINHNNLSDLGESKLKKYCFKRISKKYHHIAFNKGISDRICSITNCHPTIIPHGLLNIKFHECEDIISRNHLTYKKYLFLPTKNTGDLNEEVVNAICNSSVFNNFLSRNGMKMVMRKNVTISDEFYNNYIYITHFLTNDEYYTLISKCHAVLLCLNEQSFNYRISGTLFECMRLDMPVYIYHNRSLECYGKYYKNCSMMFKTTKELINLLELKQDNPWDKSISEIASPKEAWKDLLKELH